jgi:hypothetical protein
MALNSVMAQILSESSRLWAYLLSQMQEGSGGFADDCQARFAQFASQFEELVEELSGFASYTTNQIQQNLNPFVTPMYLHIHAAIPRQSDGSEQVAIPNQNNNTIPDGYIMGKGRIHCVGLAGSYVPEGISMTIRQFDKEENLTRESSAWQVPICLNNNVPTIGAYGGEFNSAMCWIIYGNPLQQPPSHCSGLYPYFEKFGYHPNSYYTQFDVECLPEECWWSAACVWESDQSHNAITWRDQQ